MNKTEILSLLKNNFNGSVSQDLDAEIELRCGEESLFIAVREQTLLAHEGTNPANPPEIVLFFDSLKLAYHLLDGTADPVIAFMNGRLRSDSNLVWVFQILNSFRKS